MATSRAERFGYKTISSTEVIAPVRKPILEQNGDLFSRVGQMPGAPLEASKPAKIGGLRISSENEFTGDVASKKAPARVEYSSQQSNIIHCPAKIIIANAFAGTGKTTTAIGFAEARSKDRNLYVVFTSAGQKEAKERFGNSAECRTINSLAWAGEGHKYGKRIEQSWRALNLKNDAGLGSIRTAAIAQSILSKFFQSADSEIGFKHTLECEEKFRALEHEVMQGVVSAKKIWLRMQDLNDTISIPHDAYLKIWALKKPKLNYDNIIFDEAQDTNPVSAEVIRGQTHVKQVLYIGDRHQSIYQFRGAMNAMEDFMDGAKKLDLSETWRFGPKVANYANLVLRELKGETIEISGMGTDAPYKRGDPVTILSRTNSQLFKTAAQRYGEGVHWVGGSKSYQFSKLLDAYHLFSGKRDQIKDIFLRQFSSWGEMQSYAEESKDPETKILSEVIDEFRYETPELVRKITENEVVNLKDADVTLTTAHKSKGLDFDYVQIADDFEILEEAEEARALDPKAEVNEQELNLLYVVLTRAKKSVQLNKETSDWVAALPKHRIARELAIKRHEQRESARNRP